VNSIWYSIIIVGVLTYLSRLSFILFSEKIRLRPFVLRTFKYIPIVVLAAIIFPEVIKPVEPYFVFFPRLAAGLFAIFISWRTKNVILTIICGMLMLYFIQFLFTF
jgi:branched-subunit amino acid transport protein